MLPVLFHLTLSPALAPFLLALLSLGVGAWQAYSAGAAGAKGRDLLQTFLTWATGSYLACFALVRALGDPDNQNLFALRRPLVLPLHTYGLLIATAFVVAIWLAGHTAARAGLPDVRRPVKGKDGKLQTLVIPAREAITDLSFWLLLAGMLGSRILFILVNWEEYAHEPFGIFAVWKGGLVFYGGFIAATATAFVFLRKNGIPFLPYADVLAPSVSIGHAIGRLGCFAAGCCWGGACDPHFALAARFPPESLAYQSQASHGLIAQGAATTLPIHPTQLYESAGELAIFLVLTLWRPRKRFNGELLALYLMLYAPLRATVEVLRGDEERGRVFAFLGPMARGAWWNLSTSELISLLIFAFGVALYAALGRKSRAAAQTAAA